MVDKLMYIPFDDTKNYPYCRLQLVFETFEHSFNESCCANEYENIVIKR